MAKHSRGKHTKPKAVLSFMGKKSDTTDDGASTSLYASAETANLNTQAQNPQTPESLQITQPMPPPMTSKPGEHSRPTLGNKPSYPAHSAEAVKAFNSNLSSDGAGAAVVIKSKRVIFKRIGFACLAVFLLLAAFYFAGVIFFYSHFMPNTYISSLDISLQTPEKVRADISDAVSNYSIRVVGHGMNEMLTSKDTGLDIDAKAMTDSISAAQDPWKWPVQIFRERDMSSALADSLSATTLSEVVNASVAKVNESSVPPQNAKVEFDKKSKAFAITPEDHGSQLDPNKVLAAIISETMSLGNELIIRDDMLVQPDVLQDNPIVVTACNNANALIKADMNLMLDKFSVGKIDANQISEWITISPDYSVSINNDSMKQWADELANKFNTTGATRNYTRPDGKNITVKGGDYGWSINSADLVKSIIDGVNGKTVGNLDIPVSKKGNFYSANSGQDWGPRYVDVDISEQHARFYDENKNIIWETDIVTGSPGGRATPQGVFDLNSKAKNVTLVGRNGGEIEYETPVTFWMPFKGNSIGLHDATWQPGFGGNRYRNGFGSHGCVNLPYSKAEALYGMIQVGDVVVVHY